ncbi:MAG TPA: helix-turn-helix domain-containing protein [Blastococcus sp.]|nr:helix-turn-helix domain-containing protein [Blastococcus sp.]
MRRASFDAWPCSIARAADLLGDGWTLLVLREVFYGEARFDGLTRSLGIARNTLADRLRGLVDAGLLEKRPYRSDPVRHEYVLTEKGRDFFGVLAAINAWGDRWMADGDGPPVTMHHHRCDTDAQARVVCSACGDLLHADEVTARPGPGYPARLLDDPAVQRRFRYSLQPSARAGGASGEDSHESAAGLPATE